MQRHSGRPGAPRDDWGRFIREAEHEGWDAKVRRCVKCGLEKDWRPRKDRPGGQAYCKGCMHAYWQVWRRRKRDAFIAAREATILAGWRG